MFFFKIRYMLFGMILSVSLITIITQASTVDGVFVDYFRRMMGTCSSSDAEVLTGFDSTSTLFGTKACNTLTSLLDTIGIDVTTSGDVGIGVAAPIAKLQTAGMVKSSPTTIADSSDTLTTRSYVDAGLIDMCTKIGGTWDIITNQCQAPSCLTALPACQGAGTCTLKYFPTSVDQSWVKDALHCGFTCTGGYTGNNCEIIPLNYCTLDATVSCVLAN